MRESVGAALSLVPKVAKPAVKSGMTADMRALLDLVKKKPLTARQAVIALGWFVVRVTKAEDALSKAGLIHYPSGNGYMEAVE